MPRRLEFFFDCSSPWTYLAFSRVHDVIERTGAVVAWKPILVGGVFNAADAYEKIRAGATLVQIYTSLIYEGPGLPKRIVHGLLELLHRDGFTHIHEAVGRDE